MKQGIHKILPVIVRFDHKYFFALLPPIPYVIRSPI